MLCVGGVGSPRIDLRYVNSAGSDLDRVRGRKRERDDDGTRRSRTLFWAVGSACTKGVRRNKILRSSAPCATKSRNEMLESVDFGASLGVSG